jgi:hypothetical protein
MFFRRNKIDLRMINPSSKISLKMSCLASCGGDVDKATKLYAFLSEGIDSIPDFDIPRPSVFEQIKSGAGDVFGWFKENKNEIAEGVNFIQSLRKRQDGQQVEQAKPTTEALPPLPNVEGKP